VDNGFAPIRRGIVKHLEDGRMSATDFAAYAVMIMGADRSTGIWIGSARKLSFLFNGSMSERTARRALESLETNPEGAYIKRFARPGSHGNYPILINRYECTDGARKGLRLNADATTDWKDPVYYDPRAAGGQVVEDVVEDVDEQGGEDVVEDVTPTQDLRSKNREFKLQDSRSKTAPKGKAPSAALPLFNPCKEHAEKSWPATHSGNKPTWGAKDFAQLARILRRHRELTLEEFSARWGRYLADSDSWVAKQGHSLAFFCSRFDSYIDRSGLDIPEATPYEDS